MPASDERQDPFLAFRFVVRVDGESMGGFSEVSGLQAEIDVLELQEGGQNGFLHKLPGRAKFSNVTLRRGLASPALWDWFMKLVEGELPPDRRTVAIELLPPAGDEHQMRWVLDSAFPSRWTGPDLKADQSAVAVEAVELGHHGFSAESPG